MTHEPAVAVWAQRIVALKDGQALAEFSMADFHDAHSLASNYQEIISAGEAEEVGP